jgi:hypothetical protein
MLSLQSPQFLTELDIIFCSKNRVRNAKFARDYVAQSKRLPKNLHEDQIDDLCTTVSTQDLVLRRNRYACISSA